MDLQVVVVATILLTLPLFVVSALIQHGHSSTTRRLAETFCPNGSDVFGFDFDVTWTYLENPSRCLFRKSVEDDVNEKHTFENFIDFCTYSKPPFFGRIAEISGESTQRAICENVLEPAENGVVKVEAVIGLKKNKNGDEFLWNSSGRNLSYDNFETKSNSNSSSPANNFECVTVVKSSNDDKSCFWKKTTCDNLPKTVICETYGFNPCDNNNRRQNGAGSGDSRCEMVRPGKYQYVCKEEGFVYKDNRCKPKADIEWGVLLFILIVILVGLSVMLYLERLRLKHKMMDIAADIRHTLTLGRYSSAKGRSIVGEEHVGVGKEKEKGGKRKMNEEAGRSNDGPSKSGQHYFYGGYRWKSVDVDTGLPS